MLSNNFKLLIAKSDRETKAWLPLWTHAADTANVIKYLLADRYDRLSEICGIEFVTLKKTAVLSAYLHDIGKAAPFFQAKILVSLPERRSIFEHYNIKIPELSEYIHKEKEKSHHTVCGEAILLKFGFPSSISSIVGAHHGAPADADTAKKLIECYEEFFYGKPPNHKFWDAIYDEWIRFSLECAGFSDASEIPPLNKKTQVLLSGLLIMADWLASDQNGFELLDQDTVWSETDYPKNRVENALSSLNFPDVWEPYNFKISDEDFSARFSFLMNDIQKSVIKAAEGCEAPGLFILEAPMGIGKTEAALSLAEILAKKCAKTGLFFGLPTQATANGIFERVAKWAEIQSADFFHSINLTHGSAEFQSKFAEMKNVSQVDPDGDSGLVVHSFFNGAKQSLLADFVVGTVDKLLMSALKKKHVMLLHLGLSQKVVIIDECHAYDAYMNRYLDRALAWLHEYGVPVILLSATLPEERRKTLVNAYFNNGSAAELPNAVYPRLTYTDNGKVRALSLPFDAPNKSVSIARASDDAAAEEIVRAVNSGACVGVICNTVLRAQQFAERARTVENANVILYHAQFVIPDRIQKEETLKNAAGKDSTKTERRGTVVIGTQVLEQSLDIDFDILITDLCPMDLLIQRIGRLHRHRRGDRPDGYKNAECIVLGTGELLGASERIYTKWLLLRTRALLPNTISVPADIDGLVCETYKSVEPSGEEEHLAFEKYRDLILEKERKAGAYLMPAPRDSKRRNDLHDWLNNGVRDDENKALAAVRDGISSIEVIVLIRYDDDMLGLLPWHSNGEKYSFAVCPPESECKLIAQQRLRLPSIFCCNPDATIDALEEMDKRLTGFQHSHWLKGELVLLLNEQFKAALCGFEVAYSRENGFYYKKEDKN